MTQPASHSVPKPGEIIGLYEVREEIGRGGMATILDAVHQETGEVRALKLMLPGAHTEEVKERFQLEHQTLSRLDHPGILKVFEFGTHGDRPYIVMERIQGRELGVLVEDWRELPSSERFELTQRILTEVAEALEYIHEQGLVHRDVTPSNIMVVEDGTIRLMDFGVVKDPGADLTVVGEVVGTVAYIAPEQITGTRVDARTDLYSLGAVLYLMLTGRRPFSARTMAGYLDKHRAHLESWFPASRAALMRSVPGSWPRTRPGGSALPPTCSMYSTRVPDSWTQPPARGAGTRRSWVAQVSWLRYARPWHVSAQARAD